jgi:ABC-2 type transport system ATP-binding protein
MPIIRVNDVHKKFRVYSDKGHSLKERLLFRNRNRHEDRWVLKGIDFEAKKGEAIALIGQNGCGKSTLLKLMTRIMHPDKGNIEIEGRVSSLIELGAGFHPNMSGRENIYTNASIFGLSRKEIDARLKDIIDFSELGEYIDNPVRTYSSGMYMRLAFSVAINVDADVLLIDEILAVGDANFQVKCFERLRELKTAGVTTVIVTHDMSTAEKFCTQALWLNDGLAQASGRPAKVVDAYLAYMNERHYEQSVARERSKSAETSEKQAEGSVTSASEEKKFAEPNSNADEATPAKDADAGEAGAQIDYSSNRFGLRHIEITKAEMLSADGVSRKIFKANEPVTVVMHYKRNKPIDGYVFGFSFVTLEGVTITGTNTRLDRLDIPNVGQTGQVCLSFDCLPLLSGKYILQVAVVDENGLPMDFYRDYMHFEVSSRDRSVGFVSIAHEWGIN